MTVPSITDLSAGPAAGGVGAGSPTFALSGIGSADPGRFQDALSRHTAAAVAVVPPEPARGDFSLGQKLIDRASSLSDGLKHDQQYVSKMLEQATRTGDSMQLMKALMALHDYQIKIQAVSKVVTKATSSLDQLTKLQ